MEKGFNTAVETARKDLAELINSKLQMGIPFSVISLIIENTLMEVRNGVDKSLVKEAEQYSEQEQLKSEQVEWVDPVTENE